MNQLSSTKISPSQLHVIILAAGYGVRMRSLTTPKVLHKIGGRSLLARVIDTARTLQPTCIHVVHGENGELLQKAINKQYLPAHLATLNWVAQLKPLGTGHAVQQVLPHLPSATNLYQSQTGFQGYIDSSSLEFPQGAPAVNKRSAFPIHEHCEQACPSAENQSAKSIPVIIMYGDVPLITTPTLRALLAAQVKRECDGITLLTTQLSVPTGYGRIVRDTQHGNAIRAIVEEKDASPTERLITEINSGIICTTTALLQRYLPRLQARNEQGEYYLTDIVALAIADGYSVDNIDVVDFIEIAGVNDKAQLATLERAYQRRVAEELLCQGVTLLDPMRLDVRASESVMNDEISSNGLCCATDVTIDVNVIFEGNVSIGANSYIGANCSIKNTIIGNNVMIRPHSVIEGAIIEDECVIGPFARIRPKSYIARGAHVGNFVEIKNTMLGAGSKANHLSYVGDAVVGRKVNIGAGTITCNYDGVNKHQTIIEDDAFIGSNSSLVAPVVVGKNATIGAGSTITHDAPCDKLTIARSRQTTLDNWQRSIKTDKNSRE